MRTLLPLLLIGMILITCGKDDPVPTAGGNTDTVFVENDPSVENDPPIDHSPKLRGVLTG